MLSVLKFLSICMCLISIPCTSFAVLIKPSSVEYLQTETPIEKIASSQEEKAIKALKRQIRKKQQAKERSAKLRKRHEKKLREQIAKKRQKQERALARQIKEAKRQKKDDLRRHKTNNARRLSAERKLRKQVNRELEQRTAQEQQRIAERSERRARQKRKLRNQIEQEQITARRKQETDYARKLSAERKRKRDIKNLRNQVNREFNKQTAQEQQRIAERAERRARQKRKLRNQIEQEQTAARRAKELELARRLSTERKRQRQVKELKKQVGTELAKRPKSEQHRLRDKQTRLERQWENTVKVRRQKQIDNLRKQANTTNSASIDQQRLKQIQILRREVTKRKQLPKTRKLTSRQQSKFRKQQKLQDRIARNREQKRLELLRTNNRKPTELSGLSKAEKIKRLQQAIENRQANTTTTSQPRNTKQTRLDQVHALQKQVNKGLAKLSPEEQKRLVSKAKKTAIKKRLKQQVARQKLENRRKTEKLDALLRAQAKKQTQIQQHQSTITRGSTTVPTKRVTPDVAKTPRQMQIQRIQEQQYAKAKAHIDKQRLLQKKRFGENATRHEQNGLSKSISKEKPIAHLGKKNKPLHSQSAIDPGNWGEVDCKNIESREKRMYCLRAQLNIQKETSRRSSQNVEALKDSMDKVDCVRTAFNLWAGRNFKASSIRETLKLIGYKHTIREVSQRSFKTDASCKRWLLKTYNTHTNRCSKWLDRNSVYTLKNGKPWNRRRGYLAWPNYCRY